MHLHTHTFVCALVHSRRHTLRIARYTHQTKPFVDTVSAYICLLSPVPFRLPVQSTSDITIIITIHINTYIHVLKLLVHLTCNPLLPFSLPTYYHLPSISAPPGPMDMASCQLLSPTPSPHGWGRVWHFPRRRELGSLTWCHLRSLRTSLCHWNCHTPSTLERQLSSSLLCLTFSRKACWCVLVHIQYNA